MRVSERLTRRGILACAAAIGIIVALPVRSASTQDAAAFIAGLADQAIAALTPPGISRSDREARARILLADNFAVPTIAQFVLGRYWRAATSAEREEYLKLFEDLIVLTYVDRFSRYSGEKLTIARTASDPESGDITVFSEITREGGPPVAVAWRVRTVAASFKIVDVYVEGVSMGQTQRSEFSSVIRNNGGSVAALLEEMRRRVQHAT